jgi:cell division protein FtsL
MKDKKKLNFGLIVMITLFLAVSTSFFIRQMQVMSVCKNLESLQKEIDYYLSANAALEQQIEALKSDEYIEQLSREKLGLVKPGEIQYMILPE